MLLYAVLFLTGGNDRHRVFNRRRRVYLSAEVSVRISGLKIELA